MILPCLQVASILQTYRMKTLGFSGNYSCSLTLLTRQQRVLEEFLFRGILEQTNLQSNCPHQPQCFTVKGRIQAKKKKGCGGRFYALFIVLFCFVLLFVFWSRPNTERFLGLGTPHFPHLARTEFFCNHWDGHLKKTRVTSQCLGGWMPSRAWVFLYSIGNQALVSVLK